MLKSTLNDIVSKYNKLLFYYFFSIDAGATTIQVSVKNGGIKMLLIQDNGCGISVSFLL